VNTCEELAAAAASLEARVRILEARDWRDAKYCVDLMTGEPYEIRDSSSWVGLTPLDGDPAKTLSIHVGNDKLRAKFQREFRPLDARTVEAIRKGAWRKWLDARTANKQKELTR